MEDIVQILFSVEMDNPSFMPSLHVPPGEKLSGERNGISWSYSRIVVKTSETTLLLVILTAVKHASQLVYPKHF